MLDSRNVGKLCVGKLRASFASKSAVALRDSFFASVGGGGGVGELATLCFRRRKKRPMTSAANRRGTSAQPKPTAAIAPGAGLCTECAAGREGSVEPPVVSGERVDVGEEVAEMDRVVVVVGVLWLMVLADETCVILA